MTKTYPLFGFISGFATMLGYLPHILCLSLLWAIGLNMQRILPLIFFTILARTFGDRLFWVPFFSSRMDREGLNDWRALVNYSMFSQPHITTSLIVMVSDYAVDMLLVYMALRTSSTAPIWIFFPFIVCQAISAPILGLISDFFSRKTCLLVSLGVTMLAILIILEINEGLGSVVPSPLTNFFGLHYFAVPAQIIITLCAKGLFSSTTIIARAAIADTIYIEAERKFIQTQITIH